MASAGIPTSLYATLASMLATLPGNPTLTSNLAAYDFETAAKTILLKDDVPELAQDPRFSDNQKRIENADAIERALQKAIGKFTLDEISVRLREHDAPGAPVYSVADVFEDPHMLARENITGVADDELKEVIRMPNVIGKFSDTPGVVRHAAPILGSSNREVLVGELGFDEQELAAAGIIL